MEILSTLYWHIDRILIFAFRVPQTPIFGYLLGTTVLAFLCAAVSHATMAAGMRANAKTISRNRQYMVSMHNLSLKSLAAKDKAAYKACNKEANNAFGKFFFSRAAVGMASLWPVAFALAWMDLRFSDIFFNLGFTLPGGISSFGYPFIFIPLYIFARITVSKAAEKISWLSTRLPDDPGDEKMLGLSDLIKKPGTEENPT